jgi:hypothetical protein
MSDFGQRFLLARYPTGGVVVDLESGNYYQVNASAAAVCDALREGGDMAERVAAELGVSREEAARNIADMTTRLAGPAVLGTPQGSYHFYPAEGGYVLRHGEVTVLEVDADLRIRLPQNSEPARDTQLELYVRALAPKLLFQHGATVLHASACITGGKLIAFAGVSGAGKTTTARAFATTGLLVSEDLLVFDPKPGRAEVLTEAEPFIHVWTRRVSDELLAGRGRTVSSTELTSIVKGPSRQLDRILFLDESRRNGMELRSRRVRESEALVALMAHNFLGAKEADEWRRFFKATAALVDEVETEEASTPNGVEHLISAAAHYTSNWTS